MATVAAVPWAAGYTRVSPAALYLLTVDAVVAVCAMLSVSPAVVPSGAMPVITTFAGASEGVTPAVVNTNRLPFAASNRAIAAGTRSAVVRVTGAATVAVAACSPSAADAAKGPLGKVNVFAAGPV